MTGLRIIVRGLSFTNESTIARRTIFASQMEILLDFSDIKLTSECLARVHQKVLDDWAETQRREEGQRADDDDDAHEQRREERRRDGECAQRRRHRFFAPEVPG